MKHIRESRVITMNKFYIVIFIYLGIFISNTSFAQMGTFSGPIYNPPVSSQMSFSAISANTGTNVQDAIANASVNQFSGLAAPRLSYHTADGASLSAEKITNGSFATDANWNKGAGCTISGGYLHCVNSSASTYQSHPVTAGYTHQIVYTVASYASGSVYVTTLGVGSDSPYVASNGTYTIIHSPVNTDTNVYINMSTGFTGSITGVSVKQITPAYVSTPDTISLPVTTVIAFGDSFTASGVYSARLQNDRPGWTVVSKGHSGAVSSNLFNNYFFTDVIFANPKPSIGIIQAGINDVISSQSYTTTQYYMTKMITMLRQYGIMPVVLNISPWNTATWTQAKQDQQDLYNAWLAGYCRDNSVLLADIYTLLKDPASQGLNPIYDSGDHEHPNQSGYNLIGDSIHYALSRRAIP